MKTLTLAFCGLLCLAGCSGGKNAKKILGTWEVTKGSIPAGSTFEFAESGTLRITVKSGTVDGTYKVKGDKLTTTAKGQDPNEKKGASTIKRLTDTELVIEDLEGKIIELKRVKWPPGLGIARHCGDEGRRPICWRCGPPTSCPSCPAPSAVDVCPVAAGLFA